MDMTFEYLFVFMYLAGICMRSITLVCMYEVDLYCKDQSLSSIRLTRQIHVNMKENISTDPDT